MSKYGSEKEFILTLFLLKYPQYLESIIGQKLEQAEAEVPIGRRKVDMYGINSSRRLPIYVESQVEKSDEHHLKKIFEIIDATLEGIVVWIASEYQDRHLEQVKAYLRSQKHKYIDFIALRVSQDTIERASELNKLYKLDVWNNLHRLVSPQSPPLEQYFVYSQVPPSHTGRVSVQSNYDFERTEDVKQYMLEKLRTYVPYMTNVWKSKKHNSNDCQLSIGGGRNGVNFKVSARNKYGHASIYLHFEASQEVLYRSFEKRIEELQTDIHGMLRAERRKIGISFRPEDKLDDTIRMLASILEKMIRKLGPQLYSVE